MCMFLAWNDFPNEFVVVDKDDMKGGKSEVSTSSFILAFQWSAQEVFLSGASLSHHSLKVDFEISTTMPTNVWSIPPPCFSVDYTIKYYIKCVNLNILIS